MTDSQPQSGAVDMTHSDAIVPHAISNHNKMVQTSVMVGGEWVNINDANDQKNMQEDLHKVNQVVAEAQKDILDAQNNASEAVSQASSAQEVSKVNQAALSAMDGAVKATQDAVTGQATTVATIQSDLDATKQQLKDTDNNLTAVSQTAKAVYTIASDANSNATEAKATATGLSATVSGLASQTDQLTTSINQTKDTLTTKADQVTVDKLKQTVTDNNTTLTQKANELSSTITQVSNAAGNNTALISNLTQTVDGIQSTVKGKADQSTVNQLANQITEKVSSTDYQTEIALLNKDINLRVSQGDVMSQINLEAGRVLFDSKKIHLNADSVVFGKDSTAFIPAAMITNLSADQIKAGTLDASIVKVTNLNADNISAGTLSGVNIQSTDKDGGRYEMIGPNLYWSSKESQARIGVLRSKNEVDFSIYDGTSVGDILGDDDPYTLLGAPDLMLSTAGVWGEKDKDNVNATGPYAKILMRGWEANDHTALKPGIYMTHGGSTMQVSGDFVPASKGDQAYQVPWNEQLDQSFYFNGWHGFKIDLNHLNDGTHDSDYQKNATFTIQKDNKFGFYAGVGDHGNDLVVAGGDVHFNSNVNFNGEINMDNGHGITAEAIHVTKWLGVDGYKNSIVPTTQGKVAINAYETAEYYFGDIGESQTNDTSKTWVAIDYLFGQTVNTTVPYQVFLTSYSPAHVWVSKRMADKFLVESDQPNASFTWEIKAKRKGFEMTRLKNVDDLVNKSVELK